MSSLNQVDSQADVNAFFLAARVNPAAIRVYSPVRQVPELVDPEIVPILIIGTARDASIKTNLLQGAPRLFGCQSCGQFCHVVAWPSIRRRFISWVGEPSLLCQMVQILAINENYSSHKHKNTRPGRSGLCQVQRTGGKSLTGYMTGAFLSIAARSPAGSFGFQGLARPRMRRAAPGVQPIRRKAAAMLLSPKLRSTLTTTLRSAAITWGADPFRT